MVRSALRTTIVRTTIDGISARFWRLSTPRLPGDGRAMSRRQWSAV